MSVIEVSLDEDDDVLEMLEESSREEKLRFRLTNAVDSGHVDKVDNSIQPIIQKADACGINHASLGEILAGAARHAISGNKSDVLEAILVAADMQKVKHPAIASAWETLAKLRLDTALSTGHVEKIEAAIQAAKAWGSTCGSIRAVLVEAGKRAISRHDIPMLATVISAATKAQISDVVIPLCEHRLRKALDTPYAAKFSESLLCELRSRRALDYVSAVKLEAVEAAQKALAHDVASASVSAIIVEAVNRAASARDIDRLEVCLTVTLKIGSMDVETARSQELLAELLLHHALKTGRAENLRKARRVAVARGATTASVRVAVLNAINHAASTGKINMLSALLAEAVEVGAVDADTAPGQQTLARLLMWDALATGDTENIEKSAQVAVARGATCASVRAVLLEAINLGMSAGSINRIKAQRISVLLAVAVKWGAEEANIAHAQQAIAELRLRDALHTGEAERVHEAIQEAVARGVANASVSEIVMEAVNRAVSEENIEGLEAVLAVAAKLGDIITQDITRAQQTLAELRLFHALDIESALTITAAMNIAVEKGASQAAVEAAQHRIEELAKRKHGLQAQPVVDQFSAALAVGRSERHNLLAELLAKALLQNSNTEIGELLCKMKSDGLFSSKYSRVYSLGHSNYGLRGGKPYYKPSGWLRYAICQNNFEQAYRHWCVAYHGTSSGRMTSILRKGLQRPGDAGVAVVHGQARSRTYKTIYLTPSIEYAAFPCYSEFFQLGEQHWAQLVLQCRVRPGTFREERGTLGRNKHWPHDVPIDTNFPTLEGLEWLLEDSGNVVVYGLFVREFGPDIDSSVYGKVAQRVSGKRCKGPEYEWTELRHEHLRHCSLTQSAKRARHI